MLSICIFSSGLLFHDHLSPVQSSVALWLSSALTDSHNHKWKLGKSNTVSQRFRFGGNGGCLSHKNTVNVGNPVILQMCFITLFLRHRGPLIFAELHIKDTSVHKLNHSFSCKRVVSYFSHSHPANGEMREDYFAEVVIFLSYSSTQTFSHRHDLIQSDRQNAPGVSLLP